MIISIGSDANICTRTTQDEDAAPTPFNRNRIRDSDSNYHDNHRHGKIRYRRRRRRRRRRGRRRRCRRRRRRRHRRGRRQSFARGSGARNLDSLWQVGLGWSVTTGMSRMHVRLCGSVPREARAHHHSKHNAEHRYPVRYEQ